MRQVSSRTMSIMINVATVAMIAVQAGTVCNAIIVAISNPRVVGTTQNVKALHTPNVAAIPLPPRNRSQGEKA